VRRIVFGMLKVEIPPSRTCHYVIPYSAQGRQGGGSNNKSEATFGELIAQYA